VRRPSIDRLLALHHNEDVHTEHVARLAVDLFDRAHRALRLPPRDRRLLQAAARLHDIGYHSRPTSHVEAGAELLIRSGLRGNSDADTRRIAAILLLHGRDYRLLLKHPLVTGSSEPDRLLRLAALLRVADGLDHGHLQDARVRSLRRTRGRLMLTVESDQFPDNIPAARAKADLWNRTFAKKLRIQPAVTRPDRTGVVRRDDSSLEAARRLLALHYRLLGANRDAILKREDTRPLHDLRVAIRRTRAVLRLFGTILPGEQAAALNRGLTILGRKLSGFRDRDAWVELLESFQGDARLAGSRRGRNYLRHQREVRDGSLSEVRELVSRPEADTLLRQLAWLIRVELPDRQRRATGEPVLPFAGARLRRTFKRVIAQPELHPQSRALEKHEVRRLCRRARYWTECFQPALGRRGLTLANRLKNVADALGEVRDLEAGRTRLRRAGRQAPAWLLAALEERRENAWRAYEKAWARLLRRKFRKRTLKQMDRWEGKRHS
jgi:exopolyphosphatase/guanosine-5'-triphosphate,3'-diphosphate pyrophosphatase